MTNQQPLVSIIIPTYNRAHLIGETLDSVLAQTYQNWECIVVDDGSTDDTEKVMAGYVESDSRFNFIKRPLEKPKGACACRNHGLQLAKGMYINWFDSDDLMTPNFLKKKLEIIEKKDCDFVISRSLNFDKKGAYEIKKYKGNLQNELTGKNYILRNVYWITQDFIIKREKLEGFTFDETLQSGQETNFFIILLNKANLKGVAINENLSLRRIHSSSIQQKLKNSNQKAYFGKLKSLQNAYKQIYKVIDAEAKDFIQAEIMTLFYLLKLKNGIFKDFLSFTFNLTHSKNPLKATSFFISILLSSYFNVGYNLFKFSRS